MSKTHSPKSHKIARKDMLAEYDFDYTKARPNRFADRMKEGPLVVLLDPDVAEVFTTPESVNNALRALITAIPQTGKRKTVAR